MNYVANKYKNQASQYTSSVSKVSSKLDSALSEINHVGEVLMVGKQSSNDLLTMNVVSGNEEIRSEISNIQSKISSYSGLIDAKAKELDEEERLAYERYLRSLSSDLLDESANAIHELGSKQSQ